MRPAIYALLVLASAAEVSAQAPPPPPLGLALEPATVVASGLTPGATAFLLGAAREVGEDDYPTTRLYQEAVVDTDGDGVVRLELENTLPGYTVFAVVDGASGATAAATTASFGLRLSTWLGAGPSLSELGFARVADARAFGLLLVVRAGGAPGSGAWTDIVIDGTDEDDDGLVNGGLEALLGDFVPAAGSPLPPGAFLAGDVVALLDPTTFELVLQTLSAGVAP